MAQVPQRIAPLSFKPLNYPQAVKNWSKDDLVDVVKKVLKTDMDLDFLLDLNPRDCETLVACISARMECLQKS
jgi:hypothetical protein